MVREYRGRDAQDTDREDLARFPCPAYGGHALEVEDLIAGLLDWRAERVDRVVRIFDAPDAPMVAVLAYETLDELRPESGVFVPVFGVRRGFERQGVAKAVLVGLVNHLQAVCPGGWLVFRVDAANTEMVTFCTEYSNTEPSVCEDDRRFFEYAVVLPGDPDTLV